MQKAVAGTSGYVRGDGPVAHELLSVSAMERLTLTPLPYREDALEPHISRETVALHHEKHHGGYVKQCNALIAGKPSEAADLESLIRSSEGAVFESSAQIWNHDFYWRSMHPAGGGAPPESLGNAIVQSFGGFERMRRELVDAGARHFGSGWLWIVSDGEQLRITSTPDADLPLRYGYDAILCIDIWEHAYYLDYRNERAGYLEVFLDHLANWEFAAANWRRSLAGDPAPLGDGL